MDVDVRKSIIGFWEFHNWCAGVSVGLSFFCKPCRPVPVVGRRMRYEAICIFRPQALLKLVLQDEKCVVRLYAVSQERRNGVVELTCRM